MSWRNESLVVLLASEDVSRVRLERPCLVESSLAFGWPGLVVVFRVDGGSESQVTKAGECDRKGREVVEVDVVVLVVG